MRYFPTILLMLLLSSTALTQNILFEEDFNGGIPNDWSPIVIEGNNTASASWIWTTFGPMGDYRIAPLQSTTSGNGWAIFDSAINCRGAAQDAWLVSPRLSATDQPTVFLSFQTYYQSFDDRPTIEVSTDSVNWTSIEVFPEIEANEFGGDSEDENPQIIVQNISDLVGGAESFWFAFRFLADATTFNEGNPDVIGCAYSWQIDDVRLTDADARLDNDLSIAEDFYAVAPNAFTPASQVEGIFFLADVQNEGRQNQSDAVLTVQIEELQTANVVFTEEIEIPFLEVDSVERDIILEDGFLPARREVLYEGSYNINTATADEAPGNNRRTFVFGVSDTIYSKWFERLDIFIRPNADNSYAYGNCYYMPNGDGFFGRYVTFAVANANQLIGETVNILTYKWEGDLNEDGFASPDEYSGAPLAFNAYTFDGTEGDFITVPMSIDEIGIPLENDSYYFTVIQYESTGNLGMDLFASIEYDYLAMHIRSLIDEKPLYASMLDIGNTGEYDVIGFGFDVVPAVDISVGESGDLISGTRPQLSEDNLIELYPNPVKDQLFVDVSLTATQAVDVIIWNAKGQQVLFQEFDRLQEDQFAFDVSQFSAGLYFLQISTKNGVRTIKFNINK